MLGTALLQPIDYTDFLGISNDLSNRIEKYSHTLRTFESFVDTIKTKNMTRTAISRALLHMILGHKKTDMDMLKSIDDAPYIRLLGLKAQSSALLKQIQTHSDIPVITKPSAARHQLNQSQLQIFNQDVYAARIYRLLQLSKKWVKMQLPLCWLMKCSRHLLYVRYIYLSIRQKHKTPSTSYIG